MSEQKKSVSDEEAARLLGERESTSPIKFDETKKAEDVAPVSLGKSEEWKQQQQRADDTEALEIGWKAYPIDQLPSQGRFYPEGTTIAIRSASVAEIRHFSTIDENDPLDWDDKLNAVVDKCIKLRFPERHGSWKDLKEEDRFQLIFAIREITFLNGENKLFVNIKCGTKCLGDGTYTEKIELTKENFEYYQIDPKLMRHYSPANRCFTLQSPKVGEIKLYVPSLGVTTFVKNYIRDKQRRGEFYDKTFLRVASFLFDDWRMLNDVRYKKAEQDSFSWNTARLSAILKLVELIRFGVKTEITRNCDKCGVQVSTPLNFPGGIKSLFLDGDPLADIL